MNSIFHHLNTSRRAAKTEANTSGFRHPHYDCRDQGETLRLTVFVPGVEASGVEISAKGPDLTVTARKAHFLRVNFDALKLEAAQKDYLLKLRLGNNLDYANLRAEIHDEVLTIDLPKKDLVGRRSDLRLVA